MAWMLSWSKSDHRRLVTAGWVRDRAALSLSASKSVYRRMAAKAGCRQGQGRDRAGVGAGREGGVKA